jgi:lipopolysaccharide/colanic/teichoic acid biosynthesis glycosyltransferase
LRPPETLPLARAEPRSAPQPHAFYDISKRLMDAGLSLTLLFLTAPVLIAASVAILVTTRQNPLLVQRRVGLLGREFPMLKLRTMARGAVDRPLDEPGEVFVPKTPDDPRVTPVGRLLRRTSIDELPQLLNVLAGQMSLVGPRPALPAEVARYPRSWQRRLTVKPGLTGLWQVSGRSDIAPRRRTAMDRLYIRRRSLAYDCRILTRTVAATLSMRGAW